MSENNELTSIQKFLLLTAVTILMIVGSLLAGLIFKDDGEQVNSGCYSAKSSFCLDEPEPDYEQTIEESKSTPDATPYDSLSCSYSCKQLQKEAEEEQKQIDQQIDTDPNLQNAQ